jgi:LmbE family N-acetylglucosaminyl deacetylase
MSKTKTRVQTTHKASVPTTSVKRLFETQWFSNGYVLFALAVLLGSTIFWSLLSARVHSGNADQLVNPYLFDSKSIMRGAMLPGQHTFLLKWPVFYLTKLFGETTASYETVTAGLGLITVSSLAYILHRIDPRPYVKGTLFLALASVLLVIPAQPYPGGLLPVNMAMIATRNIEYILYIAAAWAIVRARRIISPAWFLGCAGLIILIASDKLFLSLSISAALAACVVYVFRQRLALATLSARWFITTLVAAIGSLILLGVINALHIVHIIGQGNGPYGVINSVSQLVHGIIGAASGLLTNFGANPAGNTISLKAAPTEVLHHLVSLGGPIIIINAMLLLGGLAASFHLLITSLKMYPNKKKYDFSDTQKLSLLLIWTSLAAYGAFVGTNHFYPVDARYLSIGMFALFITIANFTRSLQWEGKRLALIGGLLITGMALAVPSVLNSYHNEKNASSVADQRNYRIAQAISSHKVSVLVGDYWRVVPIKQLAKNGTTIMPLANCITPRDILTSSRWQEGLKTSSFAYVLSLDKSQTDFPACSAAEVFANYGKPNASVVIEGSILHPKELLLFYDHGIHKSAPVNAATSPASPTVEAVPIETLPSGVCSVPTSLNIVAHQDDDLLFMNPDIQHEITAGHCVRTVYITAGDAGSNQYYWLGREQGSEAAYSKMIGSDAIWIHRIIQIGENQYITVANPKGNTKISLIFMHLPDGNIGGSGFGVSNHESLQKLYNGQISSIQAIYGGSVYSSDQLTAALVELMHFYQPADIRTQAAYESKAFPDHSDHMAVSRFTVHAYEQYELNQFNNSVTIPLKHYIGYPIHSFAENVSGEELDTKTAIFLSYAKHDSSVCQSVDQCAANPAYGAYLRRQYAQ